MMNRPPMRRPIRGDEELPQAPQPAMAPPQAAPPQMAPRVRPGPAGMAAAAPGPETEGPNLAKFRAIQQAKMRGMQR